MYTSKEKEIIDVVYKNLIESLPLYRKNSFGFKREWEKNRHKELWNKCVYMESSKYCFGFYSMLDFLDYVKAKRRGEEMTEEKEKLFKQIIRSLIDNYENHNWIDKSEYSHVKLFSLELEDHGFLLRSFRHNGRIFYSLESFSNGFSPLIYEESVAFSKGNISLLGELFYKVNDAFYKTEESHLKKILNDLTKIEEKEC